MFRSMWYLIASVVGASGAAAGELECRFNCTIDAFRSNIEWKPSSGCYKPMVPFLFTGSTAREYNDAVATFNRWVTQVDIYVDCVRNEALSDIRKMPEIIVEGAKKHQSEATEEVDRARSQLRMMRP